MNDPFEQFERSRTGLVIPLLLFLAGALPTALAIGTMADIKAKSDKRDELRPTVVVGSAETEESNRELSTNPQDEQQP